MNALPTPSANADAAERAQRTLLQGLAVDVLAGVSVALAAAVAGGIEWTQAYWVAFALAVGKSVLTAAFSYFARRMMPPAFRTGER